MKRIVFDIEATGLSEAQICQLSYLIVDDSGVVGKNQFFAVDDMNPDAEAVHGFSMEMLEELSGGLRFADLASAIYAEFASANLFIGHNIAADVRYLQIAHVGCDVVPDKQVCRGEFRINGAGEVGKAQSAGQLFQHLHGEAMHGLGIGVHIVHGEKLVFAHHAAIVHNEIGELADLRFREPGGFDIEHNSFHGNSVLYSSVSACAKASSIVAPPRHSPWR